MDKLDQLQTIKTNRRIVNKSNFTHLHVHSKFSLIDSLARPEQIFARCEQLGMSSVAITDHYSLAGTYSYYQTSKNYNVKYICGIEGAFTPDCDELGARTSVAHIVLIAKNKIGYQHLLELNYEGYKRGKKLIFGRRIPVYDWKLLHKYREGLFCLSACMRGRICRLLAEETYEAAYEEAIRFQELFKGNYYLELQAHSIKDQQILNKQLTQIAKKAGIPRVITCDVHYINREDAKYHDLLLAIQEKVPVDSPDRKMSIKTDDLYLKTEQEVAIHCDSEPIANTKLIADQCEAPHWLNFKGYKLPKFDITSENIGKERYEQFQRWKALS